MKLVLPTKRFESLWFSESKTNSINPTAPGNLLLSNSKLKSFDLAVAGCALVGSAKELYQMRM
jgi:hypothetical protein